MKEIEYTGLKARSFVDASSRYYKNHIIKYGDKITYPIYRKANISFAKQDQYYEITQDMEYRPDLVSYYFFGAPDFWWKLLEMNGLKDILEFKAGRTIRIPASTLLF